MGLTEVSFAQQTAGTILDPPGFAANLNADPLKAPTVTIPRPSGMVNAPIHDDLVTPGSPQPGPQPAKAAAPKPQVVRAPSSTPAPANDGLVGKVFSGPARAVDGNTIVVAGQSIVLHGADAPELGQTCNDLVGVSWNCGDKAKQHLAMIVAKSSVRCVGVEPVPNSVAATCTIAGEDVSSRIIDDGYAVVPRHLSPLYGAELFDAQSNSRGIWVGSFSLPSDYRSSLGFR